MHGTMNSGAQNNVPFYYFLYDTDGKLKWGYSDTFSTHDPQIALNATKETTWDMFYKIIQHPITALHTIFQSKNGVKRIPPFEGFTKTQMLTAMSFYIQQQLYHNVCVAELQNEKVQTNAYGTADETALKNMIEDYDKVRTLSIPDVRFLPSYVYNSVPVGMTPNRIDRGKQLALVKIMRAYDFPEVYGQVPMYESPGIGWTLPILHLAEFPPVVLYRKDCFGVKYANKPRIKRISVVEVEKVINGVNKKEKKAVVVFERKTTRKRS